MARQQSGADVQSESCSRIVPPSRRPATTSCTTDWGVAAARQSRPHAVHSTVDMPRREAVTTAPSGVWPYGGRNQRGDVPVVSSTTSRARVRSSATRPVRRHSMLRCTSPWTPMSWPASATSRASRGAATHHLAEHEERRPPAEAIEHVEHRRGRARSGPSSKVSATCPGRPTPASAGVRAWPRGRLSRSWARRAPRRRPRAPRPRRGRRRRAGSPQTPERRHLDAGPRRVRHGASTACTSVTAGTPRPSNR